MMMKTYCEGLNCITRRMLVNSVTYKRAKRIQTKTAGVEFAAFAAKYGTRIEEEILAIAVRLGL